MNGNGKGLPSQITIDPQTQAGQIHNTTAMATPNPAAAANPAYPGAKHDIHGHCLRHPKIKLCVPNDPKLRRDKWEGNVNKHSNNNKHASKNHDDSDNSDNAAVANLSAADYKVVRKTCFLCGESANQKKARKVPSHGFNPYADEDEKLALAKSSSGAAGNINTNVVNKGHVQMDSKSNNPNPGKSNSNNQGGKEGDKQHHENNVNNNNKNKSSKLIKVEKQKSDKSNNNHGINKINEKSNFKEKEKSLKHAHANSNANKHNAINNNNTSKCFTKEIPNKKHAQGVYPHFNASRKQLTNDVATGGVNAGPGGSANDGSGGAPVEKIEIVVAPTAAASPLCQSRVSSQHQIKQDQQQHHQQQQQPHIQRTQSKKESKATEKDCGKSTSKMNLDKETELKHSQLLHHRESKFRAESKTEQEIVDKNSNLRKETTPSLFRKESKVAKKEAVKSNSDDVINSNVGKERKDRKDPIGESTNNHNKKNHHGKDSNESAKLETALNNQEGGDSKKKAKVLESKKNHTKTLDEKATTKQESSNNTTDITNMETQRKIQLEENPHKPPASSPVKNEKKSQGKYDAKARDASQEQRTQQTQPLQQLQHQSKEKDYHQSTHQVNGCKTKDDKKSAKDSPHLSLKKQLSEKLSKGLATAKHSKNNDCPTSTTAAATSANATSDAQIKRRPIERTQSMNRSASRSLGNSGSQSQGHSLGREENEHGLSTSFPGTSTPKVVTSKKVIQISIPHVSKKHSSSGDNKDSPNNHGNQGVSDKNNVHVSKGSSEGNSKDRTNNCKNNDKNEKQNEGGAGQQRKGDGQNNANMIIQGGTTKENNNTEKRKPSNNAKKRTSQIKANDNDRKDRNNTLEKAQSTTTITRVTNESSIEDKKASMYKRSSSASNTHGHNHNKNALTRGKSIRRESHSAAFVSSSEITTSATSASATRSKSFPRQRQPRKRISQQYHVPFTSTMSTYREAFLEEIMAKSCMKSVQAPGRGSDGGRGDAPSQIRCGRD